MRYRTILVTLAAVTVSLGSGAAYAYFTSSGTATRSGSTGALTVTLAATVGLPSSALYPGGTGDVTLEVTNPNSFAVTLVSVMPAAGTVTASNGCSPTGVSLTSQTGLSIPIAASGTTQVDLPGAASMSNASANACQGATFSIPVVITVQK
jgi:hypothetical protein